MAKHIVKCAVCGESFDLNIEQGVKYNTRRYAHFDCFPTGELVPILTEDEKHLKSIGISKEDAATYRDLTDYIQRVFGEKANWPMIQKTIKKFITEYHYTVEGILKSLVWFYDIKKNSIEKANGNINIVPYIYEDAKNYYYALYYAEMANQNKTFTIQQEIVQITSPQVKVKQKKLFKMGED